MTRPGRKRREAEAAPARTPRREESRRPEFRRDSKPAGDAVAGKNSVVEALRAKVPAKELLIAERTEVDEKIAESLRLAKNANLVVKEVPRAIIDGVTGTSTHQGIALVIKPFNYTDFDQMLAHATKSETEDKKVGLIIGMDGVTDPHNLGAIVRSAAAFGADGVAIPERRNASMTGSAWKASAGAAARMPIAQVTNLVRSIEDAKKAGFFVVGLAADGDEDLPKFSLAQESLYVIVGSEGKGLSRLAREKCDLILSIPMSSSVESLNASVATAIVMQTIAAQRAK
jgi:23S rRNA (guanosine2251-2'-O)-methyltransferase